MLKDHSLELGLMTGQQGPEGRVIGHLWRKQGITCGDVYAVATGAAELDRMTLLLTLWVNKPF